MSLTDYFPEHIRNLPAYAGQFEAYELTGRDCRVLFGSYPAGSVVEAHSHDTDNVGIITRGELRLTMDGKTSVIRAGEWYHVPKGKEHAAAFAVDTADIEFWFSE